MRYIQKPIVVDAVQFNSNTRPWPEGVVERWVDPVGKPYYGKDATEPGLIAHIDYQCVVQTLEGDMIVSKGDWIITGVKGELYPCKPDIFEQTYELVRGQK